MHVEWSKTYSRKAPKFRRQVISILASYSGHDLAHEAHHPKIFFGFSQFLQANTGIIIKIRPRQLSSSFFQINYSLINKHGQTVALEMHVAFFHG
jgi:hypothetical protein